MNHKTLEAAYGGLLHDTGKAFQRTRLKSDLSPDELKLTPISSKGGFHTHLHAGYTSRFLRENLGIYNEFEYLVSAHHLNDLDDFCQIIKQADQIASAIDRNDGEYDNDSDRNTRLFQEARLRSIFNEVNFGKNDNSQKAYFPVEDLNDFTCPVCSTEGSKLNKQEAVEEYAKLFGQFQKDVNADPQLKNSITTYAYDRMNALFYAYMTTIPASTFEGNKTFVSLYDHSKLTSAIAACISEGKSSQFHMLEFDISGIQKFIFRITEGSETKSKVAKSLRGRSFFISMISDYIASAYLNEFGLPQANIIFNTGGGAMILLPDTEDYRVKVDHLSQKLQKELYELFYTQITFVYADVECDRKELERFRQDKAIELKARLDEAKSHKFEAVMGSDFFHEPPHAQKICAMCGESLTDNETCEICSKIVEISDVLTRCPQLILMFQFEEKKDSGKQANADIAGQHNTVIIKIGDCKIVLCAQENYPFWKDKYSYIESINHTFMGMTRFITSEVPLVYDKSEIGKERIQVMDFEKITELANKEEWGDAKLGILKMDVDNLGAVFAYGMGPKTRSLSKYLTLSRMMELFFGKQLPQICKEVSKQVNPAIDQVTENGTMFYINYAGGDDLVILGPAAGILQLALAIHQRFSQYTLNPDITISGGIYIQKPASPVRFGVLRAEDQLERSKSYLNPVTQQACKNALTVLDTTIPFDELDSFIQKIQNWKHVLDHGILSRTAFYSLMVLFGSDKLSETVQFEQYTRAVPMALYSLCRNVNTRNGKEGREFLNQMKKDIQRITSVNDLSDLRRLITQMKLTIMQTRG